MKAGLTIEELATEVMRQKDAKADYIVNTSMLAMEHCGTELVLRVLDDSHIDRIEPLDIADTAHRQIGTRLGIPAKYYGKMLTEHPDLLVTNVNAWFEREPTERMLRVLDGKVRAYLSNSYMRMDHYEIFASVLPVIGEIPDVQFVSCHITDNRMYIKAVDPHLTAEVAPGDTVKAGVVISNSEVGLGSVSVQPLIYRELDGNGIAVAGATTKRIHRGRVNSAEEHFMEYDLGDCMFCELCVNACNFGAIKFVNDFENAVFDRNKLVMHLDKEVYKGGSLPNLIDGGAPLEIGKFNTKTK